MAYRGLMKQYNLIRQFSLLSFLSVLGLGALLSFLLHRSFEKNVLDQTKAYSVKLIRGNIKNRLRAGTMDEEFIHTPRKRPDDYRKAREIYSEIISSSHILQVKVYSTEKIITFSYNPRHIGAAFKYGEKKWNDMVAGKREMARIKPARPEKNIHYRLLELYVPIFNERSRFIGVFEIYVSLEDADRRMTAMTIRLILYAGIGFLTLYLVLFIIVFNASRSLDRLRKVELIKNDLSRYFSPQVAEQIATGGGDREFGRPRGAEITVLFLDIRGFTARAESSPPEETFAMLNRLYDRLIAVLFSGEGVLDKIMGDGMMGLFGVPREDPRQCDHALKAALEMQGSVARFNESESNETPLAVGIGINTGYAIVGHLGSEGKKIEYTAIGDVVNTAARLEATAGPGEIIISDAVRAKLAGEYNLTELDPVELKGKEETVKIFRVNANS